MSAELETDFDHWAPSMRLGRLVGRSARGSAQTKAILNLVNLQALPGKWGRMLLGLHLSFVAVAEEVLAHAGKDSDPHPLDNFNWQTTASGGQPAKTLTFLMPRRGKAGVDRIGIRGAYNDIADVVRNKLLRFDYPSSAPHSTQEWRNYQKNLEAIFAMSPEERRALAEGLWEQAMSLPAHHRRTAQRSGRAPFVEVLREFAPSTGRSGIPSGSVLQGLTYGFMRADAPTLNFRTDKVRTGGRKAGLKGDIDGYYGADIAQSAEVKDFEIGDFEEALGGFVRNLGEWPDTVAFVVCRGAGDQVIKDASANNITIITIEQLVAAARLWPIQKQLDAIRAALEYFVHIEQKDALITAFLDFLRDRGITVDARPVAPS